MNSRQNTRLLFSAALVLAAILPFLGSISGPWIFDDLPIIARNKTIHSLTHLPTLWTSDYWRTTGANSQLYRPFTMTTYALNWAVTAGATFLFHLTNIALHAACVLLVWFIFLPRRTSSAAFLAAAFFALHPVHSEAVANIVGRSELLVALFFLFFVVCHRKQAQAETTRQRALFTALEALAALAMVFSKETGAVLLFYPFIEDYCRRTRFRAVLPSCILLPGVALIYILARIATVGLSPGLTADVSPTMHLQLSATAAAKNLQLLVAPAQLRAVWRHTHMFGTAGALAGILALTTLTILALLALRKRTSVAAPLALLLLSMGPLLHIKPNVIWVWERGLYVPSIAIAVLLYEGLIRVPHRLQSVTTAAMVLLLVFFAWKTTTASNRYRSEIVFWDYQYEVDKDLVTSINYSEALLKSPVPANRKEGVRVREEALARSPNDGAAVSALVVAYMRNDRRDSARNILAQLSMRKVTFTNPEQRDRTLDMLAHLARSIGEPEAALQFIKQKERH